MLVKRKELINTFKQVKPGLAGKEVIEQATNFIFKDGHVITYNDEVTVRHPLEIGIQGAVEAQPLHDLLNKTTSEEVDISYNDNGKGIIIKGGRFRAELVLGDIRLPLDEIPAPRKWAALPPDFLTALHYCLASVTSDMSRPVLTCIHVNGAVMQSCDNYRMTRCSLSAPAFAKEILFPAKMAEQLLNYEPVAVGTTKGWVHFKTGDNVVFSSRTYEGDFPNLDKVLQIKGQDIKFPPNAGEVLDRAAVVAEVIENATGGKERSITIDIKNGGMTIKSSGPAGKYEEQTRARYKGPGVSFNINAFFLKEILEKLREAVLNEDNSRLRFEGEGFTHVVALVHSGK
jgi:DNA polymerase III sliding clamp (beta) subunit (PCNA family)